MITPRNELELIKWFNFLKSKWLIIVIYYAEPKYLFLMLSKLIKYIKFYIDMYILYRYIHINIFLEKF